MKNTFIRSILSKRADVKTAPRKCTFVFGSSKKYFSNGTQNDPVVLSPSSKAQTVLTQVQDFVKEHVQPKEKEYLSYMDTPENAVNGEPIMKEWNDKAKESGLFNLFLQPLSGLTNVDYAHIAEFMGHNTSVYPQVFNCNAPDTGNMEVLHMYGSQMQQDEWLTPLLNADIRSAFCMTEPGVASSDATNMEATILPDGDSYIVNGRKWWSTGAANRNCTFGIVMGRTGDDKAPKHQRHSMIIVPFNTPGVQRVRNLTVFNYYDYPLGHSDIVFDNVRVPKENLIFGEGRGFEIAQGRLGPGRIHHCMRAIGMAEKTMEYLIKRADERVTFGKRILDHQVIQHQIAEARIAIDQCRLLTLYTAYLIDKHGAKRAKKEIAMIKVATPRMLCDLLDKTIQIHGAGGLSDDFPLAEWYAHARTLRLADGPDDVHLSSLAKSEIKSQLAKQLQLSI